MTKHDRKISRQYEQVLSATRLQQQHCLSSSSSSHFNPDVEQMQFVTTNAVISSLTGLQIYISKTVSVHRNSKL